MRYGALAKRCFRPLSHLTKISGGQYASELAIANTDVRRVLAEGLTAVPDDASLHYALGLALVRAQRTAEGFTHIERAAARAPDNMRFVYTYAVSLHSAGKAREAIAVLEKALRRRPNDRDLLIALATFNRDQGALEPALRYAERMAAQYPDDPEAQRLVAQLRARSPR